MKFKTLYDACDSHALLILQVLEKQRSQADLLTTKLKIEINREKLETKNLKLRNTKLRLEIRMLKQSVQSEENAMLALSAVQSDNYCS